MTQLSLKWLFFCLGIPKKFQEHDILTFSLLHVNNQDLIHTLLTCTAVSIRVALGIGNWAIVSYCLVVTQGNHCIVWYAQIPNSQPLLNQLYKESLLEKRQLALNDIQYFHWLHFTTKSSNNLLSIQKNMQWLC